MTSILPQLACREHSGVATGRGHAFQKRTTMRQHTQARKTGGIEQTKGNG
jgi:hypothetical protein